MSDSNLLMMIQLIAGALTTLFAIMLWAKTRDAAWMLVIIGVIMAYGNILLKALELFGIVRLELQLRALHVLAIAALENLPFIFIAAGLLVMINRKS